MLLSILIPTYNRAKPLKKNLYMIEEYVNKNNLIDDIKIIISNNCSTDKTQQIIDRFYKQTNIKIDKYSQNDNLGLEGNALFVLEKADTEYVMYLSDDDFLDENYIVNIVDKLSSNKKIHCVLPSYRHITPEGVLKDSGRDLKYKSETYKKGFKNCLKNSWRGHQLTGVTFKRKGTYNSYIKNNVNNIYPFIYFVAYNSIRGKTWHFTKHPVLVTSADQKDKDWGYGKDGLISEIFDNYKKMDNINKWQRSRLELKVLDKHSWRYYNYIHKGFFDFMKAVGSIEMGENTSFITRLIFPFVILKATINRVLRRLSKLS